MDDDRLKTAIAYGFGATHEEAAEYSGKSLSTVRRWQPDPEIRRVIEAIAAYKSIVESKRVSAGVTDLVSSAEDRLKAMFDRALRLSEKRLMRAEAEGDDVTTETLKDVHENFTKFLSKFAASEAPKRVEVGGGIEHLHKHVVSLSEAKNAILTGKELDDAFSPRQIAGIVEAQEAEIVS